MNKSPSPIRLVGLSGSIRKGSYNTVVLRSLAEAASSLAKIRLFPLDLIPPYNQDLDGALAPAAVVELKAAIADADGLVLCSPEYNYGMSGVLKNAIDWASRPGMASPLKGKPVLIMTASPAYTGGVRAHAQLREALCGCLSRVVTRPQVVIAAVHEKVVDGRLVDQSALNFAVDAVRDLIVEVQAKRQSEATQLQG